MPGLQEKESHKGPAGISEGRLSAGYDCASVDRAPKSAQIAVLAGVLMPCAWVIFKDIICFRIVGASDLGGPMKLSRAGESHGKTKPATLGPLGMYLLVLLSLNLSEEGLIPLTPNTCAKL